MLIKRHLLTDIAPFLQRKEYIAITGPRQAGKTTLLELIERQLVSDLNVPAAQVVRLTFEDRKVLAAFESDPVAYIKSYISAGNGVTYLLIDEFQYAEQGGMHLKLVYDTIPDLKVILTGSSSLDIKARVSKYMVGRLLTFHLYPFSFGEALQAWDARLAEMQGQAKKVVMSWLNGERKTPLKGRSADVFATEFLPLFERYAIWGGYPASVLTSTKKVRHKVLNDIFNTYILKDIKTLLELATERNLHRLSQHLATQTGNLLSYQNLGQASGLEYRSLMKHLNILAETFVCRELRPFFNNRKKELTKIPKVFFYDTGFRNILLENMNGLVQRPDAGAIVENACWCALQRSFEHLHFWRTKSGAEVDFILKIGGEVIPVEVKFSPFTKTGITRSLGSFIDTFQPSRALVLTKDYIGRMKKNDTDIAFVPVYYL